MPIGEWHLPDIKSFILPTLCATQFISLASRDRLVVRTLRCGRSNPGSNPGHGMLRIFFPCNINAIKIKKCQNERAQPGFEPGTSRTQSENHTPRPLSPVWLVPNKLQHVSRSVGGCQGHVKIQELKILWQRWDSNPRPRRDWCLKPAP